MTAPQGPNRTSGLLNPFVLGLNRAKTSHLSNTQVVATSSLQTFSSAVPPYINPSSSITEALSLFKEASQTPDKARSIALLAKAALLKIDDVVLKQRILCALSLDLHERNASETDRPRAIRLLEEALRLNGPDQTATFFLLYKLGLFISERSSSYENTTQVIAIFKEALQLNPGDPNQTAKLLFQQVLAYKTRNSSRDNDQASALDCLEQLILLPIADQNLKTRVSLQLVFSLNDRGTVSDKERIIELLEAAIKFKPTDLNWQAEVFYTLARSLYERGSSDDRQRIFDLLGQTVLITTDPEQKARAYYDAADIYNREINLAAPLRSRPDIQHNLAITATRAMLDLELAAFYTKDKGFKAKIYTLRADLFCKRNLQLSAPDRDTAIILYRQAAACAQGRQDEVNALSRLVPLFKERNDSGDVERAAKILNYLSAL